MSRELGADAAALGRSGVVARGLALPATLLAAVVGLAAAAVAGGVVAPLGAATIDPDASASVLYFQRLLAGQRLEAFVPTTPKPLLTLVYGLAWGGTHDWRVLTWLALVAFGVGVGATALFVWRSTRDLGREVERRSLTLLAGAAAAAAFIGVTLATRSDLALEVSRANSLVVSIACWAVAGVALSGRGGLDRRPRPVVAGVALLLGGLARFETLAIVGTILFAALLVRVGEGIVRRPLLAPERRWSRREVVLVVGLGLLAVPIACLHDALLTGDPLFWTGVPARYTALYAPLVTPMSVVAYLGILTGRLGTEWPIALLAVVGAASLAVRRTIVPLLGLGGLAAGMVVLMSGLAVRGVYISARYYEPLDFALLGLAAFGIGRVVEAAVDGFLRLTVELAPRALAETVPARPLAAVALAAALTVGGVSAVAASWPISPLDPAVASSIRLVRAGTADLDANAARLADVLATAGALGSPPSQGAEGSGAASVPAAVPLADPRSVVLFVPSTLRSRVVVETGASLTAVGDTLAAYLERPAWSGLHAGQWLYHDPAVDRPAALTRELAATDVRLGGARASVIWTDAATGARLLRIDSGT